MDVKNKMPDIIEELSETKKLIILLLGINNFEPILNGLRLQKLLFYFALVASENEEEKRELLEYFNFYPHKAGPYSEYVEQELEELAKYGVVEYNLSDKRFEMIRLTEKGKEIFYKILSVSSRKLVAILQDIKELLNDREITDLDVLTLIYDLDKEYAMKSKWVEKVERNRVQTAIKLYKKGKISLERASEIAGLKVSELKQYLRKNI
ncbi:MAG: UPF0175 family protein [Candidatus Aenigmatarchaeota archaeon]